MTTRPFKYKNTYVAYSDYIVFTFSSHSFHSLCCADFCSVYFRSPLRAPSPPRPNLLFLFVHINKHCIERWFRFWSSGVWLFLHLHLSRSLFLALSLIFIQYFKKLIIIAVYIMYKRCRHLKYVRVECFSFYFIRAFTCTHTQAHACTFFISIRRSLGLVHFLCWGCWWVHAFPIFVVWWRNMHNLSFNSHFQ